MILFIVLILGAVFFWIKFFGTEDSWLCQNNEWVKHGNPSSPMPLSGCGPANINPKINTPSAGPTTTVVQEQIPSAPAQVSLTGLYVCLPSRLSIAQTTECALGLMTDDRNYYALNTSKLDSYIMYPTGTRLRVFGQFLPIEMDSTMTGKKYNVKGIINLDKVEEINN